MKKSKIYLSKLILLSTIYCLLSTGLWGCATYKFQKGQPPYDKGYVVLRDGKSVLEYTVGKDNSVPDLGLACQRFERRRPTVEYYYKKMGYIRSRFKETFVDPPVMLLKLVGGVFKLPFIAISDYRYNHNAEYREKIKQIEAEKDTQEEARIRQLQEELNSYIKKDIEIETQLPKPEETAVTQPEEQKEAKELISSSEVSPQKEDKIPSPQVTVEKPSPDYVSVCKAIIVAKPNEGYSPLTVHFNGQGSYSYSGRISSYHWDFGDGDVSDKTNPTNTYWSGSFTPQYFTVTLTVKDERGNANQASLKIKVMNR